MSAQRGQITFRRGESRNLTSGALITGSSTPIYPILRLDKIIDLSAPGGMRYLEKSSENDTTLLAVTDLRSCTGLALYHRATGFRAMVHFYCYTPTSFQPNDSELKDFFDAVAAKVKVEDLEVSFSGNKNNSTASIFIDAIERVCPGLNKARTYYCGGLEFYLAPDGTVGNGLTTK